MKVKVAVVLLLGAGYLSTTRAWTPPERVDRKPEGYVTYLNAIAASRDGSVHVVWSECKHGTYYEKTMYARRQGDTWTIPANISRDSGDIRTPAIALDSSGQALVVWSEESYALMRYVRQLGDSWSIPKLAFQTRGITPRLAVDGRNRVHLLFEKLGSPGVIWHSYYASDADSWATPETVASDPGYPLGWSDIAVDGRDYLHAVWMNYRHDGIDYSRHDGDSWTTPVRTPDPAPQPNDWSCYPRIAVDTANHPHVVWEERSGGYFVYFSRFDGDSWTTPYLVNEQSGLRPVVSCDDQGKTHVIWRNTGLWHIVRSDSGWSEKALVTDSATAGLPDLSREGQTLHLTWRHNWGVYYCRHDVPGGIVEELLGHPPSVHIVTSPAGQWLRFEVRVSGAASVSLWDSAGRKTVARDLGYLQPGVHEVRLPVEQVPAGRYVCRLLVGDHEAASAVVIVR